MGHILSVHIGNLRGQWALRRLLEDQRVFFEKVYGSLGPERALNDIIFIRDIIALTDTASDTYTPVATASSPNRHIEQIIEDVTAQRLVALSCENNSSRIEYKVRDYLSGEELFDLGEFSCPTTEKGFNYFLVGKINPLLYVSPYHYNKGGIEYEDKTIVFQMSGRKIIEIPSKDVDDCLQHHTELPDGKHLWLQWIEKDVYELQTEKKPWHVNLEKDSRNPRIRKVNPQGTLTCALPLAICYGGNKIYMTFSCKYSDDNYSGQHFAGGIIDPNGIKRKGQLEKILFFDRLRGCSSPHFEEIICVDGTPFVMQNHGDNALMEAYDLTNPRTLKLKKNSLCEPQVPCTFHLPPSGRHIPVESKLLIDRLYYQAKEFQKLQEQEEEHLIAIMHQLKDDRLKKLLVRSLPSIISDFEPNERKHCYDSFLEMDKKIP